MASLKRCKECGETKGLDEFWRAPRNSDGRKGRCAECERRRQQTRRERLARPTNCAHCGENFQAKANYAGFQQKYCSYECMGAAQTAKAIAGYPPKEEVERLYNEEKLSDVELGRRFGRSYQWAFKMRRYYGIAGASIPDKIKKPLHRKSDRSRWGIHLKREAACRACGRFATEETPLNLHHALPRSLAPSIKYDLRNGLPLCAACHLGWHRQEVTIYQDAFTGEEWDFLSNLTFQGFNPRAWLEKRYPPRTSSATDQGDTE